MGCAGSRHVDEKHQPKAGKQVVGQPAEVAQPDKQHADGKQAVGGVSAVQVQPARHEVAAAAAAGGRAASAATAAAPAQEAAAAPPSDGPRHPGFAPPMNDAERLVALHSLQILDTQPEARFDDITRIVKAVFKAPICAITLVDKERLWYKSVAGPDMPREMARNDGFCTVAVQQGKTEVLVVEDAEQDARFREIAAVKYAGIKFYCGAPLITSKGHKIGTLCVLDVKPRQVDAASLAMLGNFASMVMKEIERDRVHRDEQDAQTAVAMANNTLKQALDSVDDCVMLVEVTGHVQDWALQFVNENWIRMTGSPRDVAGVKLFDIFSLDGAAQEDVETMQATAQQVLSPFVLPVTYKGQRYRLLFKLASSDITGGLGPGIPAIPAFVQLLGQQNERLWFVAVTTSSPGQTAPAAQRNAKRLRRTSSMRVLQDSTRAEAFGDVRLGPLLGKGGFGKVYRAVWDGATVACKVVETTVKAGATNILNNMGQLIEAVLGQDLAHPNVVQTYKHVSRTVPQNGVASQPEAQAQQQQPAVVQTVETWLVMEYCNKGCLTDAIDRGWLRTKRSIVTGEADLGAILATAREVAAGMAYLHSLDILQGDLTPGNVLLASSDKDKRGFQAKVSDFGLSRIISEQTICTQSHGTVTHMPPELLVDGTLSKATDVYSFAVLLWEMFMGERPYAGLRQQQIMHKIGILKEQLQLPDTCPAGYKALFDLCIHSSYSQRPTFLEILDKIEDLQDQRDAGCTPGDGSVAAELL